ncbi:MAG: shikimate dehydrogenase [Thermodesulfobacteriota bacterium]|nr:shikimate dehydrogenase [Thermodesulfobacteriota bacterium]
MNKDSLNTYRDKIDALDLELLKLLNDRASVCLDIAKLKAEKGLEIHDPLREQAVFTYLAQHNKGPLKAGDIEEIFKKIVSISRRLQSAASANGLGARAESGEMGAPFTPTGSTALYGILGNPVAQSMSPLMHNTAFRLLGIDALYLPFEVNDLSLAFSGMKALNIQGASVTHPFKEKIIGLIDEVDDTAKKIGAVNTLVFGQGRVRGTNTDWVGAVRCLEALLPVKGHTFVVLGAGGAARAAVFGITSHGGKAIVVNRSEAKGRALAEEFDSLFVPLSEIQGVSGDCLVNTTPVGMYPKTDALPVPREVLGRYKAVADVVYNPLMTMLLKEAEKAGCLVASGFEMFLYQGVEQFTTWTGKKAPVKEMRDVVYGRLSTS